MSHDASSWIDVASRIKDLIRATGMEAIRETVRDVMTEREGIAEKIRQREQARHKYLIDHAVASREEVIPAVFPKEQKEEIRAKKRRLYEEVLEGSVILSDDIDPPPDPTDYPTTPKCLLERKPEAKWKPDEKTEVQKYRDAVPEFNRKVRAFFQYVKDRGFPVDSIKEKRGSRYHLHAWCLLPDELLENRDPKLKSLIPIQDALTDVEKVTVLAAIYDAHWQGDGKVAPWGAASSGDGQHPDYGLGFEDGDEMRAALGYRLLVDAAKKDLGEGDRVVVESWLAEFEGEPVKQRGRKGASGGRPITADPKEDKKIFDAWNTGQHRTYEELAKAMGIGYSYGDIKRAIHRHKKRIERGTAKK